MKRLAAIATLAALLAACSDSGHRSVPRPTAYPRIPVCDTATVALSSGTFDMRVSAAAVSREKEPGWLDIVYPSYGVTVHLTAMSFGNTADLDRALDNRMQRMSLNFGDTPADTRTFTNDAGIECLIAGSPDAATAPIYIIARRDGSRPALLSAAAVFRGATKPVDSVYPVYKAVRDDMDKLLNSLK